MCLCLEISWVWPWRAMCFMLFTITSIYSIRKIAIYCCWRTYLIRKCRRYILVHDSYCCRWWMKYTVNLFSKNCRKLEFIQEVVLWEVSKLYDLVMNKNKEINIVFCRQKDQLAAKKRVMDSSERKVDSSLLLFLRNNAPPIDGPCFNLIINSTINFFICLKMLIIINL